MNPENYVVNLEWNDTLTKIYSYLEKYNDAMPLDGACANPALYEDIKEGHVHWNQDRFFADNVEFDKLKGFDEFLKLLDGLDLDPRVCWGHVTTEKRDYVPHRERYAGSLMFPISGCTEDTVTSFAHWHDPKINASEWYWHSYNGREEIKMFSEEEIAYSYSLLNKPILFNNGQFHQVQNNGNEHRRMVTIHFCEDRDLDWNTIKQRVKTWK